MTVGSSMMHATVKLWHIVAVTLAVLVATAILEVVRCQVTAFPPILRAHERATLASVVEVYGPPDYEASVDLQRTILAESARPVLGYTAPTSLRASVWTRECFCALRQRMIVVSEQPDGRVLFSGGESRNMLPSVVMPDALP